MNYQDFNTTLKNLCLKFNTNQKYYNSKEYNEAQVRNEFIDVLFESLGWDIRGIKAISPDDREVIVEDKIESKRVDYTFKANGRVQFLVEAKKPYEKLDNKEHIFQAKSYAFSMGIPFVILTNFKEFKFFDIRVKPLLNQPNVDLINEFNFNTDNYLFNTKKIWNMFSRKEVLNGSLKKLYLSNRNGLSDDEIANNLNYANLKGESLLDKEFLKDLLLWRMELAKSIYYNNTMEIDKLNILVQKILDTILFLRIIEDREIESNEVLKEICNNYKLGSINNIYQEMINIFDGLNKKYNGRLFRIENDMKELKIDNNIIYNIIMNTYVPNSPYNFALITIDVLGSIFEQYLSNTIIYKDNEIQVIMKNEVQKAGGAYYTPQFIVNNIINETVIVKLNRIKDLKKIQEFKVADIACGSGSFLVEAYKKIIEWYENYYNNDRENIDKYILNQEIFINNNKIFLTMKTKKKILEQNIFGVDLDKQAVEITKMNLYITMLEQNYIDNTVMPILPSLDENIKKGNSIIGMDFYKVYSFSEKIDKEVSPFDFSTAFNRTKFDCIVGNPPYIRIQKFEEIYPNECVSYIKEYSKVAKQGNFDLSIVFIEKAMGLLKDDGVLGYIVLSKFFTTGYGQELRKILSKNRSINKIVDFKDQQIFKNATTYTCLLILRKNYNDKFYYCKINNILDWKENYNSISELRDGDILSEKPWYFESNNFEIISSKCEENAIKLKDITGEKGIYVGIQTDCDDVFLLEYVKEDENYIYCRSKYKNSIYEFEKNHLKKIVKGSADIRKYEHNNNKRVIVPYKINKEKNELISEEEYSNKYPKTWKYLNDCKEMLSNRKKVISGKKKWYEYIYKKNISRFDCVKILSSALCNGSRFSIDENADMYCTCSGQGGGGGCAITILDDSVYDYYSLLGILNSNVISYYIINKGSPFSGGYQGINKTFLEQLPLPSLVANSNDIIKISDLVKEILKLNKNYYEDRKKEIIKYYIEEINKLVCKLYKLNDEEISILNREMDEY